MIFSAWPKTPRLFRDIVITEKLDGTNSAVLIEKMPDDAPLQEQPRLIGYTVHGDGVSYNVQAQSRNRLITPNREGNKQADNYGFAGWVYAHAADLVRTLGPGRHFGEWWGQGIARNYGLNHKRFSLFNPDFQFGEVDKDVAARLSPTLGTVPVLYRGPFSEAEVRSAVRSLRETGSRAVGHGFDRPEGIIVYHTAARQGFKVLIEGDELPKSLHV